VKRAALHHYMTAQPIGMGELDHFEQRIFDDGIGKAGGNIGHRRAFLLCLLHIGIHEHRTA